MIVGLQAWAIFVSFKSKILTKKMKLFFVLLIETATMRCALLTTSLHQIVETTFSKNTFFFFGNVPTGVVKLQPICIEGRRASILFYQKHSSMWTHFVCSSHKNQKSLILKKNLIKFGCTSALLQLCQLQLKVVEIEGIDKN